MIRRRKKACDDVTASQILVVLLCCVWLYMSRNVFFSAAFGLNNRKSGANKHLRFYPLQKIWKCAVWVPWLNFSQMRTHTRHISEFFGNGKNRRFLFTPNLRLFKPNPARDKVIYTNSQTQHWRTTNIWLAVTSSQVSFSSSYPRIESA